MNTPRQAGAAEGGTTNSHSSRVPQPAESAERSGAWSMQDDPPDEADDEFEPL
jgi:hypothetical protein